VASKASAAQAALAERTSTTAAWKLAEGEAPTEEDGVTTAWIQFETEVARGYVLMRIKGDKIWTLLTTMVELKGHEEPAGDAPPLAATNAVWSGNVSVTTTVAASCVPTLVMVSV